MSLKSITESFSQETDASLRATFEAAMVEHIETNGLTMKDVLFDIYKLQLEVARLQDELVITNQAHEVLSMAFRDRFIHVN